MECESKNNNNKLLRVGIIGSGFIGKQHIEAIRRIPGTEIIAIADNNIELAKKVSENMSIPNYYSDYSEMLEKEQLDVVHNCTPSMLHFSINKAVINKGVHIYCEKPLTLTAVESRELLSLVKKKGVAAATNFNYRHNVMVKEMKERVKNNAIGKILTVYAEYLQDWLMYDTDYDWRLNPDLGGDSRAVADIGSHCFDTLQYVLDKKIVAVNAQLFNVYPIRKKVEKAGGTFDSSKGVVLEEVKVNSEDGAYIMLKFEDGTNGLCNLSQVSAGKKNGLVVNIDGSLAALRWEQERCDKLIIGKRDVGNEELFAGEQYLTGNAKNFAILPNGHSVGWADALKNAISVFYESIRNEDFMEVTHDYASFKDAHYIMKLIEACLESSKKQSWITID